MSTKRLAPCAGAPLALGLVLTLACLAGCHRKEPPPASGVHMLTPAERQAVAAKAQAGDPAAQLQMGSLVLESAARPGDFRQAEGWFQKAAEAGNAEGQYRLGTLYQSGRVPDPGGTNALFWFKQAAAQNHAGALFNLGSMYGTGQGVPRDPKAAAGFFRQAAELGDAYAQFNLARRLAEGQGIATNLVEAWKWFTLAEGGGIASAALPKRLVEARMAPAQLSEARRAVEQFQVRTNRGS